METGQNQHSPKEIIPEGKEEKGQTRDIVAKKVGLGSGKRYEQAKKVVESGDKDLIEKMNKTTVGTAFKELQSKKPPSGSTNRIFIPKEISSKTDELGLRLCPICQTKRPLSLFKNGARKCGACTQAFSQYKSSNFDFEENQRILNEMKNAPSIESEDAEKSDIEMPSAINISEFEQKVNQFVDFIYPYNFMKSEFAKLSKKQKDKLLSIVNKATSTVMFLTSLIEDRRNT